jgi:hypothetical protein
MPSSRGTMNPVGRASPARPLCLFNSIPEFAAPRQSSRKDGREAEARVRNVKSARPPQEAMLHSRKHFDSMGSAAFLVDP